MNARGLAILVLMCMTVLEIDADAQGFLKRLGWRKDSGLPVDTISDGLREALKVGIERAITSVGEKDGYFRNKKIKIPLPKSFRWLERPLRAAGYDDELDEFILSMNRAAEAAAPLAQEVFINTIVNMSIEDAKAVLNGHDTEATDYLAEHTRDDLAKAFAPHMRATMNKFEVTKKYQAVVAQYADLPFARNYAQSNIEEYTANKALDGLFLVLGQEEKRIREQPVARTTDLLRKVFDH